MFSPFTKWPLTLALTLFSVLAQGQAIADLVQKAQAGDPKAQFDLAGSYIAGKGVPLDRGKGIEWLRKSADRGYAGAQVTLGYLYQKGVFREVPGFDHPNPHEAAKWYRKAAKQQNNDPQHAGAAQADLSKLLAQGLISKQEADWHEQSAQPQAKKGPPPFSFAEVETGLTGGITTGRMATLVSTYGVNFTLTANTTKRLAHDGADATLLAAISASRH
jgi:TPR repeat protein